MSSGEKQDLDVTWLFETQEREESTKSRFKPELEFQNTRGKADIGGIWRGTELLAFVGWVTAVSNLPYILLLSYMSIMSWVFEGAHGCLLPNSHQALKQCECSTVTKWPWKSHPTLSGCSVNECVMFSGTTLGHEMKADSERRLPPTTWLQCNQILLERLPSTWMRVLGRENQEDHWANYLIAGIDQYDTVGRSICETCSFQKNQRKIPNKTT